MAEKTNRNWIADEMEEHVRRIRKMIYRTYKEYKEKNPNRICPICGKEELDID